MPVLPGSRYIGPGNPLPNGDPTNNFDALAERHDYQYASASDASQIRQSDREFLSAVWEQETSNIVEGAHKLVSLVGIGAKYAVESGTGVIYPSLQVCLQNN
jgi:hypothetical protein